MAKFFGNIGFAQTVDKGYGVFEKDIIEREYYGNINRKAARYSGTNVNDDITITNEISVLSDDFILENLHTIAYITVYGAKWKITDVEINYPRLTLSTGGLYNA